MTTHKRSRRLRHLHDGDVFSGPFDLGWADDGTRLWYPPAVGRRLQPGRRAALAGHLADPHPRHPPATLLDPPRPTDHLTAQPTHHAR